MTVTIEIGKRTRRRARGFTLIELSVVVVIVGVLAVIGLVGYRRYRATARMSEATNMIAAIRTAQNEYKAETGIYANVSNDLASFYPNATPGRTATQWGAACGNCKDGAQGWQRLKVQTPDPVVFGYATVAGVGGSAVPSLAAASSDIDTAINQQKALLGATDPFFVALAQGDTDGNGVTCHVLGLSHTNQLVVSNQGE